MWASKRTPGVTDAVAAAEAGRFPISDFIVCDAGGSGVDLLPAGTRHPDTLGLVMSTGLKSLIVEAAERYDCVILDSPPLFVPDATVIAQIVDLTILVARPGPLDRSNLEHACALLEKHSSRVGLVLNDVSQASASYYGKSAYYYQAAERSDEQNSGSRQAS